MSKEERESRIAEESARIRAMTLRPKAQLVALRGLAGAVAQWIVDAELEWHLPALKALLRAASETIHEESDRPIILAAVGALLERLGCVVRAPEPRRGRVDPLDVGQIYLVMDDGADGRGPSKNLRPRIPLLGWLVMSHERLVGPASLEEWSAAVLMEGAAFGVTAVTAEEVRDYMALLEREHLVVRRGPGAWEVPDAPEAWMVAPHVTAFVQGKTKTLGGRGCARCGEALPSCEPVAYSAEGAVFCSPCLAEGPWRCWLDACDPTWRCSSASKFACEGARRCVWSPDTPEERLVGWCLCACHVGPSHEVRAATMLRTCLLGPLYAMLDAVLLDRTTLAETLVAARVVFWEGGGRLWDPRYRTEAHPKLVTFAPGVGRLAEVEQAVRWLWPSLRVNHTFGRGPRAACVLDKQRPAR